MPHFPKPYFLSCRRIWKVQIKGKQHNLGADRDEAFRKYHELMSRQVTLPSGSVVGVIDRYLEWCREHRSGSTFDWYQWRLQMFCESIPATLTIGQLRHFHIDEWLKDRPDWSSCRRGPRKVR
jgi:hypothetical protein